MILEVDAGNTFLKWRIVGAKRGEVVGRGRELSVGQLVASLLPYRGHVGHIRVASVRGADNTRTLSEQLADLFGVRPSFARAVAELAGVRSGYDCAERLGVDRWLAIVASYCRSAGPCVVVDIGTAVTVDYVNRDGAHMGGFIAPGLPLSRRLLTQNTHGIEIAARSAPTDSSLSFPGRNTDDAVERGCELMVRAFVFDRLATCSTVLGENGAFYVTGGDAWLVSDYPGIHHVQDLVFEGLALACP